jgi:hypothetical protein
MSRPAHQDSRNSLCHRCRFYQPREHGAVMSCMKGSSLGWRYRSCTRSYSPGTHSWYPSRRGWGTRRCYQAGNDRRCSRCNSYRWFSKSCMGRDRLTLLWDNYGRRAWSWYHHRSE